MLTGGQMIRMLRKERKETIEHLAIDAGITYKALCEIERGITKQPSRETLYNILEALSQYARVSIEDWGRVFQFYGYTKPHPLPTEEEIEKAKSHWRRDYGHIPYPAYLVDFSQRLLDWNRYAPRLLGMRHDDVRIKWFQNVTILDITFGLSPYFVSIKNSEEYLPSLVHVIKSELQPYKDEPWYHKFISTAREKYPLFKQLWDALPDESFQASLSGVAVPILLGLPGEPEPLKFQLVRINFVADERFIIVQWIPVNDVAIRKCHEWINEEGLMSR